VAKLRLNNRVPTTDPAFAATALLFSRTPISR
jgi:hypothetical protein